MPRGMAGSRFKPYFFANLVIGLDQIDQSGIEDWLEINTKYASIWPNITRKGDEPADGEEWKDKPNKKEMLSPNPGTGD